MTVATLLSTAASAAAQATPELSTADRLADRRVVAAGERALEQGFADGRFYANGWHITGEMGGLWTPPVKLLDGIWFGVGDAWVGPARRFHAGYGYARFDLPDTAGLRVRRTDVGLDDHAAVLFRLAVTNPSRRARTVTVRVQAHSELMGAYPWGFAGVTPHASENLPDRGAYVDGRLEFTDVGALPGAPEHRYAAVVAADRAPTGGEAVPTGGSYRGPQGDRVCQADATPAPPPKACDDGPFGRGTGGELRYRLTVPAKGTARLWVAAAGGDRGLDAAREELAGALAHPAAALAAKVRSRRQLARRTNVSLPGNRLLQRSIAWGKQNLADLTQRASDLEVRWVNEGKQFPPPSGTVADARWIGAGFPDYPWIFATDVFYTSYAALALGQFERVKDSLRALRDVSEVLNDGSGIVVHEAVPDGSVWHGHESYEANGTPNFNTDETVKFPINVALVWRWTGDDGFRDEMYDFVKRNVQAVTDRLDADGDGWPEGLGNVERTGMGEEKLDNAAYYVRALYDLADMADAKGDLATAGSAKALADELLSRFEATWWEPSEAQFADSLIEPDDQRQVQKHWIGSVPMQVELVEGTQTTPGLASFERGTAALEAREGACYSGERPGSRGLFHTGCGGGPTGAGEFAIFSLNTAVQAVAEGNYGRLGPDQQRRYTDANAETMFAQPATGGTPDEMPGAMPEIFPSAAPGGDLSQGTPPNIDRCWTCRSMFMQAWGHFGTAWPVVHQQLGVRPYLGRDRVEVVPQVPAGQREVAASNVRLGEGSIGVRGRHDGGRLYVTEVDAGAVPAAHLVIGHTLPRDAEVASVRLGGRAVDHSARRTNRGLEVTVDAAPGRRHVLAVRTR